jgi:peptide-methionine (R)-S-oxide reductase
VDYAHTNMKKTLSLTLIVATMLGIFVYAQDKKKPAMPVAKEVPKSLTKEEAAKLTDEEWKKRLTAEQFRILRQAGTERSNGKVYQEFKAQGGGTYYCAGCDSELFSSAGKFDSHCGWPSFYDPSKAKNVKTKIDITGGMTRTEVLCLVCEGHLGHVFFGERFEAFNGNQTPTGQRYCINGGALKFVPAEVVEAAKKEKRAGKKEGEKETKPSRATPDKPVEKSKGE